MKGKLSSISKGPRGKRGHRTTGINNPHTRGHNKREHEAIRQEGTIRK